MWGPRNGLQQMPPLYNTYGAKILHIKCYKDRQNQIFDTILLQLDWLENPFGYFFVSKQNKTLCAVGLLEIPFTNPF